ncbi:MAG: hypothetical protein EA379_10240 [Phycisphaerales bacterium]|nr:MAG: hypothetical protein EA379_10240 [Phycisphaerales bacterium]
MSWATRPSPPATTTESRRRSCDMAPARWTGLIGAGLRTMLARRVALLSDQRHWAANSGRIQRAQLRGLLEHAARTEFGREHAFDKILNAPSADLVRAFRERVPIREALEFRDPFARMREHAEPDVTWPGVVRDWAQTSGTTAGDKFIPVSREMMRHNYHCSLDIFAHAARGGLPLSRLFSGRILFLGGSSDLTTNEHGVRTGDLSGLVTPLIRWPLSAVYLPGPKIALMSDWPAKIDAMARRCLDEDVRAVSGMASWSLVLFQRVLELAHERGDGARTLRDVWPNFELFIHGGVKYAPFEPRVREAWSGATDGADVPLRVEVYPASEAFVATQDRPGRLGAEPGLRLNVDREVYFEFVPLEEIGSHDARAFACDEVEKGQRYVVVLTTCAGLWRYVLGDVVEFDTIPPEGPTRLRIVGRHKHFINAFGENLIVEHIENAVAAAAAETGVRIGEFSAAPVYPDDGAGRRSGLELAIETEADSTLLARFADAFDRSLKSQNVDYTTKRTGDLGMAPPVLTALPPGAFHAWMASVGKLGGQHKCPRCANHREIIDGVVKISGVESGITGGGIGISS